MEAKMAQHVSLKFIQKRKEVHFLKGASPCSLIEFLFCIFGISFSRTFLIVKKFISGVQRAAVYFFGLFLGQKQELNAQFRDGHVICTLPIVEKGGVVWLEN